MELYVIKYFLYNNFEYNKLQNMKQVFRISLIFAYALMSKTYAQMQNNSVFTFCTRYSSFNDHESFNYEPFKQAIIGKKVIALGESTHGTWDFYYIKGSIFKQLVEDGISNTLILEASFDGCLQINNYLDNGEGNLTTLMNGIGYPPPVKDLIEWCRSFNIKNPSQKIKIFGMDIQGKMHSVLENINQTILYEFPKMQDELVRDFTLLKQLYKEDLRLISSSQRDVISIILKKLDSLYYVYKEREPINIEKIRWEIGVFDVFKRNISLNLAGPLKYFKLRDKYMADNIKWLTELESNNQMLFVWAHNGHIRNNSSGIMVDPVGKYLKDYLKDNYVSIGLDFEEGDVSLIYQNGKTISINSSMNDSKFIGNYLKSFNGDAIFINLKSSTDDNIFYKKYTIKIHSIDVANKLIKVNLPKAFDAFLYFKKVSSLYKNK